MWAMARHKQRKECNGIDVGWDIEVGRLVRDVYQYEWWMTTTM